MIQKSISYGLAVFACTIFSALLMSFIKNNMPDFYNWVQKLSIKLLGFLKLPMTPENINKTIVATILAMIWGLLFST